MIPSSFFLLISLFLRNTFFFDGQPIPPLHNHYAPSDFATQKEIDRKIERRIERKKDR